MQNKNTKLCKLLNIKPKYRISIYSGTHLVDNLDEVKYLLCDLDISSKTITKNAVEIYPDLYEPYNFVKLFNYKYDNGKCNTVCDFVCNCTSSTPINVDNFLEILIRGLECTCCLHSTESELIKQTVNKIEFKYK